MSQWVGLQPGAIFLVSRHLFFQSAACEAKHRFESFVRLTSYVYLGEARCNGLQNVVFDELRCMSIEEVHLLLEDLAS